MISVTAHHRVTGDIVVDAFTNALEAHGIPASTLTDNGMVFTTRLPAAEAAATASNTSSTASASSRRTAGRTIPRPAAKSNASTRR